MERPKASSSGESRPEGDSGGRIVELVGEPGGQGAELHHSLGLAKAGLGLSPPGEQDGEQRSRGCGTGLEQRIHLALGDGNEPGLAGRSARRHAWCRIEQGHLADDLARNPSGE
jgi:hypothetical protein